MVKSHEARQKNFEERQLASCNMTMPRAGHNDGKNSSSFQASGEDSLKIQSIQ